MYQLQNNRFVLCMFVWVIGLFLLVGICQHLPARVTTFILLLWMFGMPVVVALKRVWQEKNK